MPKRHAKKKEEEEKEEEEKEMVEKKKEKCKALIDRQKTKLKGTASAPVRIEQQQIWYLSDFPAGGERPPLAT